MKYLILSDLDGTLLNSKGELSEETVKYVNLLNEREDTLFAFSTGRCWKDCEWVYKKLNLKGFVSCCNSAFMFNPHTGETRFSYIGHDLAVALLRSKKFLEQLNHGFLLGTQEIRQFNLQDVEKVFSDSIKSGEKIYGVKFYFHDKNVNSDEKIRFVKSLEMIAPNVSVFSYPGLCNVEIQASYVNKEQAVKWFANYYSVKPENVLTFGDNHNDLPIATGISSSFAVKNAILELKQLVKKISIYSNDEDSVIKEIDAFLYNQ